MAIKKISQFTSGTPTDNDYILFEQNGAGKSTTIKNIHFFEAIDTSNIIASGTGILPYTATEDCWAVLYNQSSDYSFYHLNGVRIAGISTSAIIGVQSCIPLKKGDVLTYTENGNSLLHTIDIYKVKR